MVSMVVSVVQMMVIAWFVWRVFVVFVSFLMWGSGVSCVVMVVFCTPPLKVGNYGVFLVFYDTEGEIVVSIVVC